MSHLQKVLWICHGLSMNSVPQNQVSNNHVTKIKLAIKPGMSSISIPTHGLVKPSSGVCPVFEPTHLLVQQARKSSVEAQMQIRQDLQEGFFKMQPVTGRGRIFLLQGTLSWAPEHLHVDLCTVCCFFSRFPYFLAESRPIVMTGNQLDPVEELTVGVYSIPKR